MDRINQVWDSIKERLSSPFFFSFLISWAIVNWRIVISLFWNDPRANSRGHYSLIEYIESNTDYFSGIILPVLFAGIYTFIGPFIKSLILIVNTKATIWGENSSLRISKGAKIPIDKYLSLRKNYDERTKVLESILESESSNLEKLRKAETNLIEAKDEQLKLRTNLSDLEAIVANYNRIDVISGMWIKITKQKREKIEVINNIVFEYDGASRVEKYMIRDFKYDKKNGGVSFMLRHYSSQGGNSNMFYSFNSLRFQHAGLTGEEFTVTGQQDVTYERPQEPN